MSTSPRSLVVALTALAAATASLAGCSDDAGTASETGASGASGVSGASGQACRLAAVTYASLDGPRRDMVRGGATPAAARSYRAAIDELAAAVSGEGEIDPAVTAAVTEMVAAMSRTQAWIDDNIELGSYSPRRTEALGEAEGRAEEALLEACPNLTAS